MPIALITGANRGLGLEFVRQYRASGWDVIATAREASPEIEATGAQVETVDMRDLDAVAALASRIEQLDLLVANAGTYGPRDVMTASDGAGWSEALTINTIAPYLLARNLVPAARRAGGKLIAVSTRMGSIQDNSSGGFIAYRSSKAALNAAWKSLAVDHPDVTCATLHPGWVQTRMGGASAPVTPQESVAGMRRVIESLTPAVSGSFLDFRGEAVPW